MTACSHENTRFPERPVPDAWYACPDCGEKVGRRGGKIITVHENNALAALRAPIHLNAEDRAIIREALWHAVQRGDVPDDERQRIYSLRVVFGAAPSTLPQNQPEHTPGEHGKAHSDG